MQSVNVENWTYCRFQKGNFWAQITFGADPAGIEEGRLEYYVTVLENEIHEVFQQDFTSLADACMYLNANYSDWEFENQNAEKSGCSTCAAH